MSQKPPTKYVIKILVDDKIVEYSYKDSCDTYDAQNDFIDSHPACQLGIKLAEQMNGKLLKIQKLVDFFSFEHHF